MNCPRYAGVGGGAQGRQWHYNGEVVELILIISDWDPNRVALGDYVATELESIGFKVEKLPWGIWMLVCG